ncbi:2-aminoadipate transaminase [Actinidia chinensis var. chinensis]|uniref:2-aminoadipate transaminase n=1 Tax=Actinidia chinensis var. chinensis TaxID=1590841 RepID=A0A2R6QG76_ACTCC|nr:2-aminoadipate transaminase [Actinidia chinensis var. chinensis]
MGCGVSRPNAEDEAIPAKSHPVICCRIEEIKRRRRSSRAKKDTTGKELLHFGKQANEIDRNAQKRASTSPEDSIPSCVTSEDSKGLEKSTKAENKEDEKEKKGAKGADKAEEGGKDHVDDDNEGDSDEGDEGMIEASINFPGSPSFRIYFKGNSGDDDNDNDGGKKEQANDKAQNSEQSTSPKEEFVPEKAKKGRKRSCLKKSLSKGGHNSVKNLLNV